MHVCNCIYVWNSHQKVRTLVGVKLNENLDILFIAKKMRQIESLNVRELRTKAGVVMMLIARTGAYLVHSSIISSFRSELTSTDSTMFSNNTTLGACAMLPGVMRSSE